MTGCKFGYTCLAILGTSACGCAHQALDEYAVEHNLIGVQQCSIAEPMVEARVAANRGCSDGEKVNDDEGSIQNVENSKDQKEEAL